MPRRRLRGPSGSGGWRPSWARASNPRAPLRAPLASGDRAGPVRDGRHEGPPSPPAHHWAPAPRVKGKSTLDPSHVDPNPLRLWGWMPRCGGVSINYLPPIRAHVEPEQVHAITREGAESPGASRCSLHGAFLPMEGAPGSQTRGPHRGVFHSPPGAPPGQIERLTCVGAIPVGGVPALAP